MAQYHHHPDNVIYVRTSGGVYSDTLANFALDFGRAWPLPEGIVELHYDDAKKYVVHFDAGGNQWPGPAPPFLFGDAAISALGTLLAAQAKRKAAAEVAAKQLLSMPALPRKPPSVSMGTNKV